MEATPTSGSGEVSSELVGDSVCLAAPPGAKTEGPSEMLRTDEQSFQTGIKDAHTVKPDELQKALGPWMSGRVTYSPDGETTGVRPVVGRYSVTRHGENEWTTRNKTVFEDLNDKIRNARLTRTDARSSAVSACEQLDKLKSATTRQLEARACELRGWKSNLACAVDDIDGEMQLLEAEGRRVRYTLSVLSVPEFIAGELLQIRATRLDSELVCDGVEEQLVKEVALCSEIRETLVKVREEIEMQLVVLRNAKTQVESDWSDKCDAHALESANVLLTTDSPLIMWKAGTTRFAAGQSTTEHYENYTRQVLGIGEAARRESVKLRLTLNKIYDDSMKLLRDRAASADIELTRHVDLTERSVRGLEKDLLRCLHELASMDKEVEELRRSTVILDREMKLSQTRLDNRLQRRNVEDCRDDAQLALLHQVKAIGERHTAVCADLTRAEEAQGELVKVRNSLEREVIVKRKSLYVDKQRGTWLRSMYPSIGALSGYRDIGGSTPIA